MPAKIPSPFFESGVKGVNVRASRPRQGRRIVRERHEALQEKVRKIGDPVGAEETPALRKAQRQAQAQNDPGPQEDVAEAVGREAGNALVEREAGNTPEGRSAPLDRRVSVTGSSPGRGARSLPTSRREEPRAAGGEAR